MPRLLAFVTFVVGALLWALPASAFVRPNAAEVFKKVRKSVIRVSNIGIDSPIASGGYGGGSGVVFQIDYDRGVAYALTNHHVSGAAMVNAVRFWDGAEYKALLVATEPGIDTALLEIHGIPDERDLPFEEKSIIAAPLGDSDATMIGEFGIAMGSPGAEEGFRSDRANPYEDFLLQQTITMRVVSGKASDPLDFVSNWSGWKYDLGPQVLTNLPWSFMVSTAINGGNSGGPLFNSKGEVIGLNHAGYPAGSLVRQNENYTIPINFAKNFAYQILNTGKYEVPWFGIDLLFPPEYTSGQQISYFIENDYDPARLVVLGVRHDTPAERAGIRRGDVLLDIDGQRFNTLSDLRMYVFKLPIGKTVPVTVLRNNKKVRLSLDVVPKRRYDAEFSV